MIMSYFLVVIAKCGVSFVTVIFAGHINKAHLAGVGLTNTLYNTVVMSLSQGYLYVFDTYGPQVFGSDSQSGEVTNVLFKCVLQGALLHLFILGPYLNLVHVIRILPNSGLYLTAEAGEGEMGAEDDFREIAVTYLRITVIVEIMDYVLGLMMAYFVILGKKRYVCVIAAMPLAVHILANYVLVCVLQLEVVGLGLAAITGRLFALIIALGIGFVNVKKGVFPWKGFTRKILTGWKPMLKRGLAGSLFVFTSLSQIEISIFCSQFVSTATLSTMVVLVQVCYVMLWSPGLAISLSSANLIGTVLAEGSVSNVKQYMFLTLSNILLEVVPISLLAYVFKGFLVEIFSHDPEIIALFTSTFWLVCLSVPFTHLQVGMNRGMLTAFGEQGYTAMITIISNYLIALPVVLSTIFLTDLGLIGIIAGLTLAELMLFLTGVVKISRTDIEEEIEKSRERVRISTYGSLNRDCAGSESGSKNSAGKTEEDELRCRGSHSEGQELGNEADRKRLLRRENTSDSDTADGDMGIDGEARNVAMIFFIGTILFVALAIISFL